MRESECVVCVVCVRCACAVCAHERVLARSKCTAVHTMYMFMCGCAGSVLARVCACLIACVRSCVSASERLTG